MKPSALNAVDSNVKRNKPLAINRMMATSEKFHCSKRNKRANIRIKIMLVDFVIVYSDTVMNIKLQLEHPISKAHAIAVGRTLFMYTGQGKITLCFSVFISHSNLRTAAITNTNA